MLLKTASLDTRLKSSSCAIGAFLQEASNCHHAQSRIEPALLFARSVTADLAVYTAKPSRQYSSNADGLL